MFVITIKEKRQQRVTFLSTIVLMLIYFSSFSPVNVNLLSRTHTYTTITNNKKTNRTVWCSLISLFLTRTIIWVSLSLFIYILSCFFFAFFSFFFCLLGSFGPETKNQPSQAFDDKQVKERANVSPIIYMCRSLEVSSVSQKKN
jgi:flagellar basal body-associated protein FliL